MATKYDLEGWLVEALKAQQGSASIVDVGRYVWEKYEAELKRSGDLFLTWLYDIRWAARAALALGPAGFLGLPPSRPRVVGNLRLRAVGRVESLQKRLLNMASGLGWQSTRPEMLVSDAIRFLGIALEKLEQAGMTPSAKLASDALASARRDFETLWNE